VRVTKEVFEAGKGLVHAGWFPSEHVLYKVALLQSASPRSILSPGTLAAFPRPEGPRSVKARTYLSNAQDPIVRKRLGRNMGSAANAWVWLVSRGVPAAGTSAFMGHRVQRGSVAPAPPMSQAHENLGSSC
jgi:hypothetical protein